MFEKVKTKRQIKKVSEKIRAYNVGNFSDLPQIGNEIYKLAQYYNNQIKKLTDKIIRDIVIATSLEHKKFFLSYTDLKNKVATLEYWNKHHSTEKEQEELKFYTELLEITNQRIEKAIATNRELNILKYRFHNSLSTYKNPNFKQITKTTSSKFDNLTLKKQIEMLEANTFYKLSEDDIKELYQAIANSYCDSLNIKRIPVIFTKLDKYSASLGEYATFGNFVRINNENSIDDIGMLKQKNLVSNYLQYRILATVIHECDHSRHLSLNQSTERSKYIHNSARINNHYMLRIFYSETPYPETPNPGYKYRIHEMSAFDESIKFLFDVAKLNPSNAKQLEFVALNLIPKKYPSKNTLISEMKSLVFDYGLPQNLAKSIYENMQVLGLTKTKNLVVTNDKIDYRITVENNFKTITKQQMSLALEYEEQLRKTYFDTLFNRDKYFQEYAIKYNSNPIMLEREVDQTIKNDTYFSTAETTLVKPPENTSELI